MRQRTVIILLGICLGASLFSGCAETPEEPLVKQKGEASLKNYEEGQSLSGEQGGTGEEAKAAEDTSSEQNLLSRKLGAPEHYQSERKDETGKLQILTDAEVEIPDTDKVSAIAVSQHNFDQAVLDRITDTFFPDAEIYSYDSYSQRTKADYQKEIEKLKGYVAEGNLDPYHWGTDENGSYIYDIYQMIGDYEQEMAGAPEEKNLEAVRPQQTDGKFWGVASQPDGSAYNYIVKSYGSMPMEVRVEKIYENVESPRWMGYDMASGGNFDIPDEETFKQEIGITLEEAQKLTDEKTAMLQLENMEMTSWEYGICYEEGSDPENRSRKILDTGYMLHYTRKLNGIPITYTDSMGGGVEDMNSDMETWGYETLDFMVTKDGIGRALFINQYDIGEVRTENLNLMPFDKIMETYEKMMVIKNADVLNYADSRIYHIDRIAFGYSRIYEPSTDSRSGLLVPVWDFFGEEETVYNNEGQLQTDRSTGQYDSILTINAVDGSVIDRELGY